MDSSVHAITREKLLENTKFTLIQPELTARDGSGSWEVTHYSFTLLVKTPGEKDPVKGPITGSGNELTPEMKSMIKQYGPNATIYIEDITLRYYDLVGKSWPIYFTYK